MHTSDDMQLLEQYAKGRSEEAFTALVSRNINLVYSAAMRSVNNPHQAEEITQAVFVTLARKSGALRQGTVLSGWLYQTARLTASNFIRSETRRLQREQQAHIQSTMNAPEAETWTGVGPLLEEAMAQLNERERDAIVLRFFEGKPLKEVGDSLGTSEEAAQMRVSRALDKLRDFFHRRGITMPAAALAAAISENSIQAAPVGLAASVASSAGAVQGTALTASTLGLAKGAIQMMTATKISVAIGACAAATIIALQWQQVSTQEQFVKQLKAQLADVAQTNKTQQAEIAKLHEQNAFYAKTTESAVRDLAKARARASAVRPAKPSAIATAAVTKGNTIAEQLQDPDKYAVMRDYQASMVKKKYAPVVKQLKLSPEQADQFYQILIAQVLRKLDAIRSGTFNPDDEKSTDADLQALLGDSGMAQFKDFNQKEENQFMLTQINTQIKNIFGSNPLTDTQQQLLQQAMISARQSVTANSAADSSSVNPSDMAGLLALEAQQQERINQNVLQQAAAFLSPDQLQTLGASQSNQLSLQTTGKSLDGKTIRVLPSGFSPAP